MVLFKKQQRKQLKQQKYFISPTTGYDSLKSLFSLFSLFFCPSSEASVFDTLSGFKQSFSTAPITQPVLFQEVKER